MKTKGFLFPEPEVCPGSPGLDTGRASLGCTSPRLSWGNEGSLSPNLRSESPDVAPSGRHTSGSVQRRSLLASLHPARLSRRTELVAENEDTYQKPKSPSTRTTITSFKLSMAEGGVPDWYQSYIDGERLLQCPVEAAAAFSRRPLLTALLMLTLLLGGVLYMISPSQSVEELPHIANRPDYLYIKSAAILQGHNYRSRLGQSELLKFRRGVSHALGVDLEDVRITSISSLSQQPRFLEFLGTRDIQVDYEIAVPSSYGVFNYSRVLHDATISGSLKQSLLSHGIACHELISRHVIHHLR